MPASQEARALAPSSPTLLICRLRLRRARLCFSELHRTCMPSGPMPFWDRSAAVHLQQQPLWTRGVQRLVNMLTACGPALQSPVLLGCVLGCVLGFAMDCCVPELRVLRPACSQQPPPPPQGSGSKAARGESLVPSTQLCASRNLGHACR